MLHNFMACSFLLINVDLFMNIFVLCMTIFVQLIIVLQVGKRVQMRNCTKRDSKQKFREIISKLGT